MIQIREIKESDKSFIYSTFLRGVYYGCPYFNSVDKVAFFSNYPRVLDRLMNIADVRVACLADDPDVIIGFAITRPNILDYVYVKGPWRKQGVAKQLLQGQVINYVTHITKPGEAIAKAKKWKHNPWML